MERLCKLIDTGSMCSYRYNGKTLSRERLRQAVSDQLGLRIAPDPLFLIQQNRIKSFCCNDSDFLINFIMEVQICH